jgi:hypothetical protein
VEKVKGLMGELSGKEEAAVGIELVGRLESQ